MVACFPWMKVCCKAAAGMLAMLAMLASPGGFAVGDAAGQEPLVLMLAWSGDESAAAFVAGEVGSQLADVPARLEIERPDGPAPDLETRLGLAREAAARRDALAVFWVDLPAMSRLYLFAPDAEGGRLLVREIGTGGESIEGRSMTMAVIVRGAVRGIVAGEAATGEPAAFGAGEAPMAPKRESLLGFGLAYGLQFLSQEALLLHGARLEAAVRLAGRVRLFAAFRAHPPPRIARDDLTAGMPIYPAELGLAVRLGFPAWFIETGAGAVVTVIDFDVTSARDALVQEDDLRRVEFAINPWIGAGRELGPVVAVFLRLSADVVVNRHRYVVDRGDRVDTLVHPWRLRPMALLGVGVSVF